MPNIITNSFFVGDINIPNTDNLAVSERLGVFISEYEEKCFISLFGYSFYKLYKDSILSDRMILIKDGGEYNDCFGELQKWDGIVKNNKSLLAYYIYYNFQESSATLTTGVSTSVSNTDGGASVSPAEKMVKAWNEYSVLASNLLNFLWFKRSVNNQRLYPEFTSTQLRVSSAYSRKTNIFGL